MANQWCFGSSERRTLTGAEERDQRATCSSCGRVLAIRINNKPDANGYKQATLPRHKEKA